MQLYDSGGMVLAVLVALAAGSGAFAADVLYGTRDYLLSVTAADLDGDGTVDPLDSGYVQARFGCPVGTGNRDCDLADANADGVVDPLDVGYVLSRFGLCE